MTATTIAFSELTAPDAINARTATKDGIDELTASIAAKGIILALAVRPAGNGFEVIDGRRRYQAVAKLIKDKEDGWTPAVAIPVVVREDNDAEALETSLAANIVRLPMHPVDQHEVFARLVDEQGLTETAIAARFGLSTRAVRAQLALGRLAPVIRKAWRAGEIGADEAQAFAGADMKTQQSVFKRLKRDDSLVLFHIKRELFGDRRDVTNVRQAILDAYVRAGGVIDEDLFDQRRYVSDLAKLTAAKDEIAAAASKAAQDLASSWGFAWVALDDDLPGNWRYSWRRAVDRYQAMSDKERAKHQSLMNKYHDAEDEAEGDRLLAEAEALEHKCLLRDLTPDMRAKSGVVIMVDDDTGAATYALGVLRPADEKKKATATATPGGSAAEPTGISNALLTDITAQQTEAADKVLAANPMLALRVLVAARRADYGGPVKVRIEGARSLRDGAKLRNAKLPKTIAAALKMTDDEVLAAVADIIASSLDMRTHNAASERDDEQAVVSALPVDAYLAAMRQSFVVGDFFGRVSKDVVLAAIAEMRKAPGAQFADKDALAKMKKPDLVTVAADGARATGWLPDALRVKGYKL